MLSFLCNNKNQLYFIIAAFLLTTTPRISCVTPEEELVQAIKEGAKNRIGRILNKNPNINAKDDKAGGSTALHFAAFKGDKDIVELLLKKGADVNAKDDKAGSTPLHIAAFKGDKDIVELLLKKGADVNAKDDKQGRTPLYPAASVGNKDMVELLLAKGAIVDQHTLNDAQKDLKELLKKAMEQQQVMSKIM